MEPELNINTCRLFFDYTSKKDISKKSPFKLERLRNEILMYSKPLMASEDKIDLQYIKQAYGLLFTISGLFQLAKPTKLKTIRESEVHHPTEMTLRSNQGNGNQELKKKLNHQPVITLRGNQDYGNKKLKDKPNHQPVITLRSNQGNGYKEIKKKPNHPTVMNLRSNQGYGYRSISDYTESLSEAEFETDKAEFDKLGNFSLKIYDKACSFELEGNLLTALRYYKYLSDKKNFCLAHRKLGYLSEHGDESSSIGSSTSEAVMYYKLSGDIEEIERLAKENDSSAIETLEEIDKDNFNQLNNNPKKIFHTACYLKNFTTALRYYKYLAKEIKDVNAQVKLGNLYAYGDKNYDIEKNNSKAVKYYKMAALQGCWTSKLALARIDEEGCKLAKQALREIDQAEFDKLSNDPLKIFEMAVSLQEANDLRTVMRYYKYLSDELKHAPSQLRLGLLYEHGEESWGLKVNIPEAVKYYIKAGDMNALERLAKENVPSALRALQELK